VDIASKKDRLEAELADLRLTLAALQVEAAEVAVLEARRRNLETQLESAQGVAGRRADVMVASERAKDRRRAMEELDQDILQEEQRVQVLGRERDAIAAQISPGLSEQAEEAARTLGEAEQLLLDATASLAAIRERVAHATSAQGEVEAYDRELAELDERLADWRLIQHGVSQTGIPALRVDVALPAISKLATEYLRECYGGGQFQIQLISQRPDQKGRRLLETLDVVIQRGGKTVQPEDLSGGVDVARRGVVRVGGPLAGVRQYAPRGRGEGRGAADRVRLPQS
jgi:exonuclease SbcC